MRDSKIKMFILYGLAGAITAISVLPILWMVFGAFKSDIGMMTLPPVAPDFADWSLIIEFVAKYYPFIFNSLFVTIGSTIFCLILAMPMAFGLVNFKLRGENFIADWILSTRMMPPIAAAIPLFIIFNGLGMVNSRASLLIAYTGFNLPFAIWVLMTFIRKVPKELIEAARVEGATWFQTLLYIVVPVSLSGIATTATFVFIFAWNEFLLALFLTGQETRTLPVVISSFFGPGRIYWNNIAIATLIQSIPPIIFAFVMQRHIVSGMTMGAVKD
tara:strand:- start:1170 stop:1988 length:819 start_codon:yes stop_codon:yes gene_type:complete